MNPLKKYLCRLCSPLIASSLPLVAAWLLHCRAVFRRSRCPIASFRCVAMPLCAALRRHVSLSRLVVTTRRLVVLSCLASSLHRAPLRISSHMLCLFGCCVVALRLVLASPCTSLVATSHCVARCCCVMSRLIVAFFRLIITSRGVVFCRRVWFSWLSHFLPSASHCTTSRRRDTLVAVRFHTCSSNLLNMYDPSSISSSSSSFALASRVESN